MTRKNKQKFSRNIYLLGATSFLNDVSSDMVLPIFPIFITLLHGGGLAIGLIGGIGDSLASFLKAISGYISDKVGKRRVIAAGFGVAGFASLLFAYATDIITLILAFVLYGLYMAIEDTVPRAYMADIAEEHEKGVVIGAYHTVFGTFVFPASVIVGYLWQNFGLSYGFIYASLMSFIAMLLAAVVIKENK